MTKRSAIAIIVAAVLGFLALAGAAIADAPGTTRPLIEPGTSLSTDTKETFGGTLTTGTLVIPRPTPRPTPAPEPPMVPLTLAPSYTG